MIGYGHHRFYCVTNIRRALSFSAKKVMNTAPSDGGAVIFGKIYEYTELLRSQPLMARICV